MFDHGMYRCDNNKYQHFIDSIVQTKKRIADGGVFHTRKILILIYEIESNDTELSILKKLQNPKAIQIIGIVYTMDIIVDNI